MYACLVLYHPTITNLTKIRTIRYLFHSFDFKIEVVQKDTIEVYLTNIEKTSILKIILEIINMGMFIEYGFGDTLDEARNIALQKHKQNFPKHVTNQ